MTIAAARVLADEAQDLRFLWLEITGNCQLSCLHCYAESGPKGSHGTMTTSDWKRVIDQASDLGVGMVQFIGGEPTQHPDLIALARYALERGIEVEVFSNLVSVTDEMWQLFCTHGVRLATSYYSDDEAEHSRITGAANSHRLTTANIAKAVQRFVPIRVGIIGVEEGQRADKAWAALEQMGVTDIGYDRLRQVGRGVRDLEASAAQLCGNCANGVLAISPDGSVWPCVFSRWLPVGNVREQSLAEVLSSATVADTRGSLLEAFRQRQAKAGETCNPCGPGDGGCSPNCGPNWYSHEAGSLQEAFRQRQTNEPTACKPGICAPNTCQPSIHCSPRPVSANAPTACNPDCIPTCQPNCPPSCMPIWRGGPNRHADVTAEPVASVSTSS